MGRIEINILTKTIIWDIARVLYFEIMEVRLEQPTKARSPMDVMLLGMVTEVRLEQPAKVSAPMDVPIITKM